MIPLPRHVLEDGDRIHADPKEARYPSTSARVIVGHAKPLATIARARSPMTPSSDGSIAARRRSPLAMASESGSTRTATPTPVSAPDGSAAAVSRHGLPKPAASRTATGRPASHREGWTNTFADRSSGALAAPRTAPVISHGARDRAGAPRAPAGRALPASPVRPEPARHPRSQPPRTPGSAGPAPSALHRVGRGRGKCGVHARSGATAVPALPGRLPPAHRSPPRSGPRRSAGEHRALGVVSASC